MAHKPIKPHYYYFYSQPIHQSSRKTYLRETHNLNTHSHEAGITAALPPSPSLPHYLWFSCTFDWEQSLSDCTSFNLCHCGHQEIIIIHPLLFSPTHYCLWRHSKYFPRVTLGYSGEQTLTLFTLFHYPLSITFSYSIARPFKSH